MANFSGRPSLRGSLWNPVVDFDCRDTDPKDETMAGSPSGKSCLLFTCMRAVTLAPIRRYTAANLIKFVFNKTVNDRHGAILRRGGAIWIPRARGQVQDLPYPPFWGGYLLVPTRSTR